MSKDNAGSAVTNNRIPKLWSKSYLLTLVGIFVASITMTIFMPLLPIYIKMIGGDASLAGVVVSIFTLAALIFRPISAIFIDKFGRKPVLVIGFVLILIGCFSYQYITIIGLLFLIRVIHGIGYSASTNATGTIVADVVPKERRGQGIGYYGFVTAASLALGPAVGLTIMKNTDIKTAFFVAAIIAAFGLVGAFFISYEKRADIYQIPLIKSNLSEDSNPGQAVHKKTKLNLGYEKTALPASLVMLFVAVAYSGIVTFLPSYASTLGISNISIFFITYAAVLLITRLIVDRITKHRSISIVLLPGIFLMAVAFILLATLKTLPGFLIAAIFFAIGYGSVQPTLNAIVISLCEPHKRGAANSTFFSALDLGIGLGALAWGFVSKGFGYPAIFYGCIAFMILAALAVLVSSRKLMGN